MKTIGTLAVAAGLLLAASAANAQMRQYDTYEPLNAWDDGQETGRSDHNFPAGPPSKTVAGTNANAGWNAYDRVDSGWQWDSE